MNILFVFYGPSGGVETLNRQRSLALKKKDIYCHFLYYGNKRKTVNNHYGPMYITNEDDEIKRILEKGNYAAIVITSEYKALSRFRELGYQGYLILEIQGYGPKSTAKAEMEKAIPYVTNHGDALLNPRTPHIIKIFDELYPTIPKFSFNNCLDSTNYTYKSYPVPTSIAEAVYVVAAATGMRKYPILAWIGRLEDNKNWREYLLIGHRLITSHNQNIKLYMFEDPSLARPGEKEAFQQLINKLNLSNKVKVFADIPNDEMAKYFSMIGDSGGFLCSTSKVEGAPYSVLEAMSCRCPVITTDSDGVQSSIIHNKTGQYYELGNIEDATNEAIKLMTDLRLRENIRSNALEHVKSQFNQDQYGENFVIMLRSLGLDLGGR